MSPETDTYQRLTNSQPGKLLAGRLGLPKSTPLRRYEPGQPLLTGPALLGAAPGGRLTDVVEELLRASQAEVAKTADEETRYGALVFDASGIEDSTGLRAVYEFLHPVIRQVAPNGRVLVLGTPPEAAGPTRAATAQRALEGFTRSVGKEVRGGATVQLVYVAPGA